MRNGRACITLIAVVLLTCQVALPAEDSLDEIIPGMLGPRDIVIKGLVIPSYLEGLQVEHPDAQLSPMQRYLLARHLLDCHHLSQALHHQSYHVESSAPILKLAAKTFEGFDESCSVEGGYSTYRMGRFFESNPETWSAQ